jgi:SP family facilitated glucose transporter-like MFS transporter 12
MEDDDRIILLPSNGDAGIDGEMELRTASVADNDSDEGSKDANGRATAAGVSDKPDPLDREPAAIVYVAAVTAAVGGLLFGYDMGVISGAKSPMQRDLGLECSQIGKIVAFLPVGAFFASLVGGTAVDRYGRRLTIVTNAFVFTVGALILALTSSYAMLLVGRFVLGFAVALSAIAECIYISEIASPEKRGMLVSLNELGITVGILVAFLVNYIFADTDGGWRIMFGLSSVVAVVQGFVMSFMPQTPQFLMIKKQEEKAEKTLRDLRLTTNVRQTMTNIRLALSDEQSSGSFISMICNNTDNIGSRLLIGFGLVFFQQFSGQPNIIYYASDVFREVGFCTEFSSTLATVGLGLMKVLSTAISLVLVDRIGRRKALLSGISGMLVSVLMLAVFAFYQQQVGLENPG